VVILDMWTTPDNK